MAGKLEGRVGIVTGAASGIGRASALVLAREGATVVVSDIAEDGGEETVHLIKQSRGDARFIRCDVGDKKDAEALVEQTIQAYGRLDWAFNNAGISGPIAPTAEYSDEAWDKVINIDLSGVFYCMRAELRHMAKQGKGAIVNTASICGLVAIPNIVAYQAAKHGVVGMTKGAALEYAKAGIRVNAVCPGYIDTPIMDPLQAAVPEWREIAVAQEPIGRMGQPLEIGEAVAWLCSDAASFVTGVAMPVDGGLVSQ
jgi:NAD(P)-dependent dehydrogenase (short-subunit alcohol dehydrogenase family)